MKRYSLKAFLTLIPKERLKQYFQKNKYIPDFDWDKEADVDKLCDTLKQCADFERIEMDFRTIHKWTNDTGITNLIEEARSPIHGNLELGEELRKMENEHESAMYIWLEYPEVFYWATELESWEYRTGKKHYYVGTGLPCDGDNEEIRNKLGKEIAAYFEKQGKGKRCQVDYYLRVNPTRHYFFAYPEDRAKGYRVYDEKDKIVRRAIKPVFEVVFEYNPEDGDLAIYAKGKKAGKKMYDEFCTKVLGFKEPPNAETEVFDLSCLKNPEFRFEEDASIPVDSITLKMVMFIINKGVFRRVTLEASPYQGNNRQVEEMMIRSAMAHQAKMEDITISKVKIEIKFKPINFQKFRPITFIIGAPQYSELSDDEKSEKARKYLRKWKILVKHKHKAKPADAA